MHIRLETYVLFDAHTGIIAQIGSGVAFPRDGMLVAEIVGVHHRVIDGARQKVDVASIHERGDLPRIATLIDIE